MHYMHIIMSEYVSFYDWYLALHGEVKDEPKDIEEEYEMDSE